MKNIQDLRKDLLSNAKTMQSGFDYLHVRMNEISGIVEEMKSSIDISDLKGGGGNRINKTMEDVDEYIRCKFNFHFNVVHEESPLYNVMYDGKI
jgi:hypothetical protein